MGRPNRSEQFNPDEVCIVHTIQRCVRRAYLAGLDQQSGKDFSYRREWIRRRLESLASVFGIDVLTYAVMSNHNHTILRNRPDVVAKWTDEEVAIRWLRGRFAPDGAIHIPLTQCGKFGLTKFASCTPSSAACGELSWLGSISNPARIFFTGVSGFADA